MRQKDKPKLRRTLGLWALVIYGVGDILGAGIYALVGEIAGIAGSASWLSFTIALAVAAVTALSYAELGSRFPRSGGEAYFCQEAFGWPSASQMIGWLVFCSGVVSLATVSRAFSGYLVGALVEAPPWLENAILLGLLVILAGINFWGIRQSSMVNVACTMVEVSGLLLLIVTGLLFILRGDLKAPDAVAIEAVAPSWMAVTQAGALAFFAFIGFEDMVNVAEEVQSPERTLPAAIIIALVVAGGVYIAVVIIATAVVPPTQLAASKAPLLEVIRRAGPWVPEWLFTVIALFAVANTGLLNFIMGSRLLYGMSQQGLLPSPLGHVHQRTQTPYWAILAVFVVALLLGLSGSLVFLAGTTSVLLLFVFCAINTALIAIKRRSATARDAGFRAPLFIPIVGAVTSASLIGFLPKASLLTAALLIGLGLLLIAAFKLRRESKS